MKLHVLALLGCAAVGGLSGCATSMPVTAADRALTPTVAQVFPTLPDRARHSESLVKRRWPDGTIELSYTYRGRHDGLPILLYSSVCEFRSSISAAVARAEMDSDHRRLLISLEQRDADSFIPAGPDASTHLLFAGMQPVGLRFSTKLNATTIAFLCLAPPQFFNAHRTAELVQDKVERVERNHSLVAQLAGRLH